MDFLQFCPPSLNKPTIEERKSLYDGGYKNIRPDTSMLVMIGVNTSNAVFPKSQCVCGVKNTWKGLEVYRGSNPRGDANIKEVFDMKTLKVETRYGLAEWASDNWVNQARTDKDFRTKIVRRVSKALNQNNGQHTTRVYGEKKNIAFYRCRGRACVKVSIGKAMVVISNNNVQTRFNHGGRLASPASA